MPSLFELPCECQEGAKSPAQYTVDQHSAIWSPPHSWTGETVLVGGKKKAAPAAGRPWIKSYQRGGSITQVELVAD